MKRTPLAVGNEYRYYGYAYGKNGFKVTAMSLPDTDTDDGGAPGVSVDWIRNGRRKKGGWYIFRSEDAFWNCFLFSNAYDPEEDEKSHIPFKSGE